MTLAQTNKVTDFTPLKAGFCVGAGRLRTWIDWFGGRVQQA